MYCLMLIKFVLFFIFLTDSSVLRHTNKLLSSGGNLAQIYASSYNTLLYSQIV